MEFEFSKSLKALPQYLFARMEEIINKKKQEGGDIISLGIGDPDLPPPKFILETFKEEVSDPRNHGYSSSVGEYEFRLAVAEWCKYRFGVDLDPEKEVMALIGSKEGLSNVARAFINEGDRVLVPDPAYPVYVNGGAILNGGVPVYMPLLEEKNFLPDIENIDLRRAKMIYFNYPNNPTGATVTLEELKEFVDFALENKLILCYDNAYSEITFQNYRAPSILQIDGAKEVAIEINSCSKTFNMTGDRIAFATGNKRLIEGLAKVKSQIDSGPPKYIQKAAAKALRTYDGSEPPKYIVERNKIYEKRAQLLVKELTSIGLKCTMPKATFYVWAKCGGSSIEFAEKMLSVNVVATPGVGFGRHGEGYIRFAVTCQEERIKEACERLRKIL
ncbi:MAG: aminotransferase class I/II-fold pyridoxal phosphate-dependent enzyme [Candidatus Bathycorpusculaceae bacterium]